jgi:hypothetical protein
VLTDSQSREVSDPACAWCRGLELAHQRVAILEARESARRVVDGVGADRVRSWRNVVGRLVHVNAGSY